MEDKNKTKSQLISELAELRQSASLSQGFSKYLIAVHRTSQSVLPQRKLEFWQPCYSSQQEPKS